MTKIHKRNIIIAVSLLVFIAVGRFVPLESYTTDGSCGSSTPAEVRLSVLTGDSIQEIHEQNSNDDLDQNTRYKIEGGCSLSARYTLYLF